MRRTTIMADEMLLTRLRALAAERNVSFAQIVREALEEKASEFRPKPRSLGIADSGSPSVRKREGDGPYPPRSWR